MTANKSLEENVSDVLCMIDNLCNKMEPYVSDILDTEENEETKSFVNETCKFLNLKVPSPEKLRDTYIRICTELFTCSWYEVLRWSAKGKDIVQLRDCLLPEEDISRDRRGWHSTMKRMRFSQEDAETILRKFGEEEIAYRLELLGGSHISRATGGYELHWAKKEQDYKK